MPAAAPWGTIALVPAAGLWQRLTAVPALVFLGVATVFGLVVVGVALLAS